jgi:ATP-dependent Lon protease
MIESLQDRYQRLLEHLNRELSAREMGRAISQRIEDSLDRQHREKHLREQIKAIQAELGETDELNDIQILTEKIRSRSLPEETRAAAERELRRLKMTPPQSSEYAGIRQFLEWILDLPWDRSSAASPDLKKAREILEKDHFGLDKVKKRILEFLAVYQLTSRHRCPILCLTGPPGVGKTSLGRSIAQALGREFGRLSLGGVKDEAEIRGHRRTYVGARPGRIISVLQKCGVNNPVFLLDEADKMTVSAQGDPAAALLEALDPEQNDTFTDHYLEVPFDLSKVLFILTANVLENIPAPLRDRLEVVEVSSYTAAEKNAIARDHLWPRELDRHGFEPGDLSISEPIVDNIVENYTFEAGCRELGRHLRSIIRSRAVAKAEGRQFVPEIDPGEVPAVLGPPRFARETREKLPQVGVVTGLAWTAAGGDLMFVEAVAMPGCGRLNLTGQLGEVLQESAQAAISFVRSKARDWNLDEEWFRHHDLHIHLPHGSIPKDGPSAGAGLVTALVSLLSGRPVRPEIAMTGEISLRGLVLPVGGLKEKILAARRAGVTAVLVPEQNLPDLQDLPPCLTDTISILPVRTLDDVIHLALIGGNIGLYVGQPLASLARSEGGPIPEDMYFPAENSSLPLSGF